MDLEQLNLSIAIDGCGAYFGTFRQWRDYIAELADGRSSDYRTSVRYNEESVTAMANYLQRTYQPSANIPAPETFGLRRNPRVPTDTELIDRLLAA